MTNDQTSNDASYSPAPATGASSPVGEQSATPVADAARGGNRNGLAIAAMVLGVVGIVFAFFFAAAGIVLGIVAVIIAIVARRRGEAIPGRGRGLIIAGIVLGSLSIVIGIANIILALVLLSNR